MILVPPFLAWMKENEIHYIIKNIKFRALNSSLAFTDLYKIQFCMVLRTQIPTGYKTQIKGSTPQYVDTCKLRAQEQLHKPQLKLPSQLSVERLISVSTDSKPIYTSLKDWKSLKEKKKKS